MISIINIQGGVSINPNDAVPIVYKGLGSLVCLRKPQPEKVPSKRHNSPKTAVVETPQKKDNQEANT